MEDRTEKSSKLKKAKRISKEKAEHIHSMLDAARNDLTIEKVTWNRIVDGKDPNSKITGKKRNDGKAVKRFGAESKALSEKKLRAKTKSQTFSNESGKERDGTEDNVCDKTDKKKRFKKTLRKQKSPKIYPDEFIEKFDNLMDETENDPREKKKRHSEIYKTKKKKSKETIEKDDIQIEENCQPPNDSSDFNSQPLCTNKASCLILVVILLEADMPNIFFEKLVKSTKIRRQMQTIASDERMKDNILQCTW